MALTGAERSRLWRQRNPAKELQRGRRMYAVNRKVRLERKAAYYQTVRKERDKTESGLLKDRNRKARRRAGCQEGSVTEHE